MVDFTKLLGATVYYHARPELEGKIVEIDDSTYPVEVKFKDGREGCFTKEGKVRKRDTFISLALRPREIPAECFELPLPVDAKVMVSNDEKVWKRRYFSHKKDGLYFCWNNGQTSWACGNNPQFTSPWDHLRLPNEDAL